MGDKDMNKMFGKCELLIGNLKPLGKVVENSIMLNPKESAKLDRLSVRELAEPLRIKPLSFECEIPMDRLPPVIGFDEALESDSCTLIIEGKPIINKPRNLKYPNKKRARRVWKKWKKRYGTSPGKTICLPDVTIGIEHEFKPIKTI